MKLEAGKYYRTRDGRKAGPLKYCPYEDVLMGMVEGNNQDRLWLVGGGKHKYYEDGIDLVEEWKEGTTMDNKITMDGKYAYRKDPFTQVRILCVDRNNIALPVVSLGSNKFELVQHSPDGRAWEGRNHDLVPLQVNLPDLWVLQYEDGSVRFSTNKEILDGAKATSKYKPRGPYLYVPKTS